MLTCTQVHKYVHVCTATALILRLTHHHHRHQWYEQQAASSQQPAAMSVALISIHLLYTSLIFIDFDLFLCCMRGVQVPPTHAEIQIYLYITICINTCLYESRLFSLYKFNVGHHQLTFHLVCCSAASKLLKKMSMLRHTTIAAHFVCLHCCCCACCVGNEYVGMVVVGLKLECLMKLFKLRLCVE